MANPTPPIEELRAREVLAKLVRKDGSPMTAKLISEGGFPTVRMQTVIAAMVAFAAQPDGMVWQDIASAPKDGRILGYMPNLVEGGRPYIAVIWWDEEFETTAWDVDDTDTMYRAGWSAGRVGSWGYEEYAEEHPTHWMPLPSGPAMVSAAVDDGA